MGYSVKKIFKYIVNGRLLSYCSSKLICKFKSEWYTLRYCKGKGKIIFNSSFIKLRISNGGIIRLNGNLIIDSHLNTPGYISILVRQDGILQIENDFVIGQNIKIFVDDGAELLIKGKYIESVSGITCDSSIMCHKNIIIGTDFLCSWNVYITDCDWHQIIRNGVNEAVNDNVVIGDHVWIGSNVIISKGAHIGNDVIVGAYTKIGNKSIKGKSTIVGLNPIVISDSYTWKRDF